MSTVPSLEWASFLRLAGRINEARMLVSSLASAGGGDGPLLVEAFKLHLLAGEIDAAREIYEHLKILGLGPGPADSSAQARLEAATGQYVPGWRESPWLRGWAKTFRDEGEDRLASARIAECELKLPRWFAEYEFRIECPHCLASRTKVVTSIGLLIYEEFLCPECFGKVSVDLESIQNFFHPLEAPGLEAALRRADCEVSHLYVDLKAHSDDDGIPRICKALGLDYLYFLNLQLAKHFLRKMALETEKGAIQ